MTTNTSGYLVGVAVILFDEHNRVVLGLRTKENLWASFGGKLEPAETAEIGAVREVFEETGLVLGKLERLTFGEGVRADGTRYVTLYFMGRMPAGQTLDIKEPHLFSGVTHFDAQSLPENMWPRERALILEQMQRFEQEELLPA